jgi:hypothetical protein
MSLHTRLVQADVLHSYKKERVILLVDQQHFHHLDQFCHPPHMPLYTANLDQLTCLQKSIFRFPPTCYHPQMNELHPEVIPLKTASKPSCN